MFGEKFFGFGKAKDVPPVETPSEKTEKPKTFEENLSEKQSEAILSLASKEDREMGAFLSKFSPEFKRKVSVMLIAGGVFGASIFAKTEKAEAGGYNYSVGREIGTNAARDFSYAITDSIRMMIYGKMQEKQMEALQKQREKELEMLGKQREREMRIMNQGQGRYGNLNASEQNQIRRNSRYDEAFANYQENINKFGQEKAKKMYMDELQTIKEAEQIEKK